MTQGGMRRTNKNYGDSPGRRGSLPITSSLFESCSRITTLAAKKAACIINTRHSLEAPLRVDSGVLASPAKRVPRDPAPTLCRALMMQAASAAMFAPTRFSALARHAILASGASNPNVARAAPKCAASYSHA
jgi:hypothetical protein